MASSSNGGSGEDNDVSKLTAELGENLKRGERILAPTRRPDGTMRKPVRIRAGYVPQDEVVIYKSRGAIWREEMVATQELPPGYDPEAAVEAKSKSKSAKRNERKKEKRQQAALEKEQNSEQKDVSSADGSNDTPEILESVSSKMNHLALSGNSSYVTPPSDSTPENEVQDIDKKIRALKKKIRLTEAQQQKTAEKDLKPEQLEKVTKLEGWRNELKLLEDKKAELLS